jgi:hypothetical protein
MNKKKPKQGVDLDVLTLIAILEPSAENVLYIISQDSYAFSARFTIDIYEKGLIVPNSNERLAKYLMLSVELTQRGWIETGIRSRITWKGKYNRLIRSEQTKFFLALLGLIAGFGFIKFSCNATKHNKEPETKQQTIQQTIGDSLSHSPLKHDSVSTYTTDNSSEKQRWINKDSSRVDSTTLLKK